MSQAICETARYLNIQIFQVAVQYRSLLSAKAASTLADLFHHIEPSAVAPLLFLHCSPQSLPKHVALLLESIDHPSLLSTDLNYASQFGIALPALSTLSSKNGGCMELINAFSELQLPYSSTAVCCAALDEAVNALSVLEFGEELNP